MINGIRNESIICMKPSLPPLINETPDANFLGLRFGADHGKKTAYQANTQQADLSCYSPKFG